MYDVIEISIASRLVTCFMAENKTERDADAIETMAVMRRGVESSFYAVVAAGKYKIGDAY